MLVYVKSRDIITESSTDPFDFKAGDVVKITNEGEPGASVDFDGVRNVSSPATMPNGWDGNILTQHEFQPHIYDENHPLANEPTIYQIRVTLDGGGFLDHKRVANAFKREIKGWMDARQTEQNEEVGGQTVLRKVRIAARNLHIRWQDIPQSARGQLKSTGKITVTATQFRAYIRSRIDQVVS